MNMLEISDSPFVATSLGTQAELLAMHVKYVAFMGRQVTVGHAFQIGTSIHHPYSVAALKQLLAAGTYGAVHTFMPLNESDIGGAVDGHAVWLCHPLICNDIMPVSWREAMKTPDHLLALSHFEEEVLKAGKYKAVTYMPPFIHPEYTRPLESDPLLPPFKKPGDFLLVSVGRPHLRKNIPGLLLVMHELAIRERLPIKLYLHASADDIVATGTGFDLRGMVSSLELDDVVFIPSFEQTAGIGVRELRALYRAADAYISTDLGEALGITRIEAMACGLPLVVPEHTSGPELCKDRGITVGTVPANAYIDNVRCRAPKVPETVDAVKWLYDNPSDRKVMGEAARRYVLSEYDNKKTAARWEQLLASYEIAETRLMT